MRLILLCLLFCPVCVVAQIQLHLTGESSVNFLPATPMGMTTESSAAVLGFAAGVELWLPGKNNNYPFAIYAQQGRGATTSQLTALFIGPAVGATPTNDRKIYAQARLMQFSYRQVGGLARVARFSGGKFEKSIMVGAGLRLIHNERVHIGASILDITSERLQVVTNGYEIDQQGIRPSDDIESGVILRDNMLRKVVSFAEAGVDFKSSEGMSFFFLLQFNLSPSVDPDLYKNLQNKRAWLQLRIGARGRIF